LNRFSSPTQAWFGSTFERPTAAQEKGWEAISTGDNALVLAPTGSGKTLAAFLWAIDRLVSSPAPEEPKRCRVLYVSPLKSLTYDVERNLRAPLTGIELEAQRIGADYTPIKVATRTGDTSQADRREIVRHPPDVLITTPESLYLMLTSGARDVLESVEAVVIDEIHAMAATKRGAHLSLSMERLEALVKKSKPEATLQRIGLSATQRPLDEIAKFLGGRTRDSAGDWVDRPVTIVDAGVRKQLDIQVVVPVEDLSEMGKPAESNETLVMSGPAAGTPEVTASIWPAMYPKLLELIRAHTSTLIFVNSRRLAERLANKLNEIAAEEAPEGEVVGELVRSHHGSIAREQRLEIEDALKAGKIPALVATSSLELGIDMGAIDLVIQVEAPPSVAAGMQRIGRAGHQVGAPSKGTFFPKFRGDLVVSAVTAQRMQLGLIEHTRVPRNPIDVLAQQIIAMVAVEGDEGIDVEDARTVALGSYPFSELSKDVFEGVLDMLSGRYPSDEFAELRPRLNWDRVASKLTARSGARMLAVTSGGTIPDRGLFGVFTPEGSRVGELDEEMVYESRVGETFLLGATTWKIIEITKERVVVVPAPGEIGKMPFWHGDALGRPFELGQAVGEFTRKLDTFSDEDLKTGSGLDELAIRNLRQYINDEREATNGVVPTDKQLVVERFRDEIGDWRVCLLSPFGAQVHAPWALGIEAKLRDRFDTDCQAIWSDDGIVIRLPEADELPPIESVLLDPDELDDLIVAEVGRSAVFAARFRENAARSLLLPRRRPGSRTPLWQMRQRASDLLSVASKYGEFPIILETYRECLSDLFDMASLTQLLKDIRSRKVSVVSVDTQTPSPFASSLAFSYVASFMYEGDAPLAERRAQALTLDRRMLSELIGGDELRGLIDADALEQYELELQCLDDRYRAHSVDSAHDLLVKLGDLTREELAARCSEDFGSELLRLRSAIEVRVASEQRLIAIEDAGRYRDALGVALPIGVPDAFLAQVGDGALQLVRRWVRRHGPFLSRDVAQRFALPTERVDQILQQLLSNETLTQGEFRPNGVEREWCDVEVLRVLRQRSLAALRKEIEPTDERALVRFLPSWQGVGSDAKGIERLFETIRQLGGVSIPASVLEADVLRPRLGHYDPKALDELVASGEVMWTGAGSIGRRDGKLRLFTWDQARALVGKLGVSGDRPDGAVHDSLREILQQRGACFFRELSQGMPEKVVVDALWDLVWAGEITNDNFGSVRSFVSGSSRVTAARGKRRPRPGRLQAFGPPAAQGRWSMVVADSAVTQTETATALADVLLERHGVLTREAVRGEGVPGGFASVYPVLRAMEDAGRIRRGYFVEGLGGAQFALTGAVDRLRNFRDAMPSGVDAAVVLAATDPANPYGVSLGWPEKGMSRTAGSIVVLVDGRLAIYMDRGGKSLKLALEPDGEWEVQALDALVGLLNGRMSKLSFAEVPEALEALLAQRGFVATPKGMVRYA